MFIKIVLFMILFHIIDDFVLQPISLSNLKQKKWWEKQEGYSDTNTRMTTKLHWQYTQYHGQS